VQCRRLEHYEKRRFVEIFWEDGVAEITSGALGSKGRTRDYELGPAACEAFVAAEVAKRVREGFVEVVPEVLRAKAARHVAPDSEWIARIAAAYDDDAPRLVYADHLQTLGDPLGELIAVQCELARIDRWEPRAAELREREETLLRTYRQKWLPKIEPDIRCTFRRGFVEHAALDRRVHQPTIDLLMRHAPMIRAFEFDWIGGSWGDRLPWDIVRPCLQQLTALGFRGWQARVDQLRALVEEPALARVECLSLRGCNITASNLEPLATRAWRELDLHANVLGLRGTETALADVSRLEALDLGSSGIGDAGAQAIIAAPFVKLRRLSLRRSRLTSSSLGRLARSPNLVTLEVLDVSGNEVAGMFDDPVLPALRELDLHDTALDDDGLAALLASPLAAQLRVLDVSGNKLTDARLFVEAELPELRMLDVSRNSLGERARELKTSLPHVRVTARNAAT
jgi:uncharacterized protein (TIGR02996 family)